MRLRKQMFRVYDRLRNAIVPGLRYSQHFYERRLAQLLRPDVDWLDLGCGHHILPPWRGSAERELVATARSVTGVDYDLPSLQKHRSVRRLIRADIGSLPFCEESFDLVTANMVVEHLRDPERQFREIRRVLRPGGLLLLHTPNALGYQTVLSRMAPDALKRVMIRILDSRRPEDVFPAYYRANTDRRLAAVGGNAGLAIARVEMVASDAMFAVVPPLAAIELVALRCLLAPSVRRYRSSIIAVLQKPDAPVRRDSPERAAAISASRCAANPLGVISG